MLVLTTANFEHKKSIVVFHFSSRELKVITCKIFIPMGMTDYKHYTLPLNS